MSGPLKLYKDLERLIQRGFVRALQRNDSQIPIEQKQTKKH